MKANITANRWTAVPVIVVAVMVAIVAPVTWVGVVFGLPAVVPLVPLPRARLGPSAQSVLALAAIAAGLLLVRPFLDEAGNAPSQLSASSFPLACAALAVAVLRLYLVQPFGGAPLTLASALIALTACGRADSGWFYVGAVALFMISGAVALWAEDPGRAPLRALSARHAISVMAATSVALVVFGGLASVLPPLSRLAMGRMMSGGRAETGFSDNLWVGSLEGMLQSDRVVMRVRGAPTDYLRGGVYTSYSPVGRWSREWSDRVIEIATAHEQPVGPGVTEVEYAGRTDRYFAPLNPVSIGVTSGIALVDRHGVLRPTRSGRSKRSWFSPDATRSPPIAPHDAFDRQVPARHFEKLRALARDWSDGASSHAGKIAAIEERLAKEYTYSIESRTDGGDPTMDFLFVKKRGHCEYFASAMALLVRTLGYPARVAGGYRVAEYNELGGYHIVRERHAHSWVEAWTPEEGWRTYDPTPPSELAEAWTRQTPMVSGFADLMATTWERLDDWFAAASAEQLTVMLLALFALLPLLRWLRERRAREQRTTAGGWPAAPSYFEALQRALASAGVERAPAETIEGLARRARAHGTERTREGAELLMRYGALRYGGEGDPAMLARDIRAYAVNGRPR